MPQATLGLLSAAVSDQLSDIFQDHRQRILFVLPDASVSLSGSASVGDLSADDLDVVALVADVHDAAARLRRLYPPLYEDEWRDDWAAFRLPGPTQVDIVIARPGTKGDAHHSRAWDLLATDEQLRAEYRSLKASRENYEERKAAFFERVAGLLCDP